MAPNSKYPSMIVGLIARRLFSIFRPESLHSEAIASDGDLLASQRRSLFLRHLDCGSCNGCELELNALSNPLYDSERFGIKFVASPRHADVLVLTGVFTRNLAEAAELTLAAMSKPRRIIAVGDCAIDGGAFVDSYAIMPSKSENIRNAIVARVEGCPPAPVDILRALAQMN